MIGDRQLPLIYDVTLFKIWKTLFYECSHVELNLSFGG